MGFTSLGRSHFGDRLQFHQWCCCADESACKVPQGRKPFDRWLSYHLGIDLLLCMRRSIYGVNSRLFFRRWWSGSLLQSSQTLKTPGHCNNFGNFFLGIGIIETLLDAYILSLCPFACFLQSSSDQEPNTWSMESFFWVDCKKLQASHDNHSADPL